MNVPKTLRALALASALVLGGCLFEEDDKKGGEASGSLSYALSGGYVAGSAIASVTPTLSEDLAGATFAVSPALPAGLSLNAATGVLSGTPTAGVDSASYVVTATSSAAVARDTLVFQVASASEASWIGKPLDSLKQAGAVLFLDGKLLIGNAHATKPGIAVVDPSTGLVTGYYAQTIAASSMAATADGRVIITETDYVQGAVSVFNPRGPVLRKSVIAFGTDNGVVSAGGRVYLIDRTTGAVTGFTGSAPGQNVVLDVQVGAESNPYDIAVADGKVYVTRYNSKSLLILSNADAIGGGARDSIDLSAYASKIPVDSAATVPRMASVIAHGGYLFVTLQRLNYRYSALDTSLVVVINASTKAIEKTLPLRFRNPISASVLDGKLYVAGIAGYGDRLGGVEAIDLATRAHAGTVLTEATLGADVFGFEPAAAGSGYVSYSTDFGFNTQVKKVSLTSVAKSAGF
jgi:hypothetical protein